MIILLHINNGIAYKTLGKVNIMSQLYDSYRNSVKKHNDEVEKKIGMFLIVT